MNCLNGMLRYRTSIGTIQHGHAKYELNGHQVHATESCRRDDMILIIHEKRR